MRSSGPADRQPARYLAYPAEVKETSQTGLKRSRGVPNWPPPFNARQYRAVIASGVAIPAVSLSLRG